MHPVIRASCWETDSSPRAGLAFRTIYTPHRYTQSLLTNIQRLEACRNTFIEHQVLHNIYLLLLTPKNKGETIEEHLFPSSGVVEESCCVFHGDNR